MTDQNEIVSKWLGVKPKGNNGGGLTHTFPDGQLYCSDGLGLNFTDPWLFVRLLTVLAERGYEPKVSHVKSFIDGREIGQWIACIEVDFDTHGLGWFEEAGATPQLALLAATVKLIESNQETHE